MTLDEAIAECEPRPAAYVLRGSGTPYLFKGSCRDLAKRMADHKAGRVSRTKNRRPLELACFEYCDDYSSALERERYFKTGSGREYVTRRIPDA